MSSASPEFIALLYSVCFCLEYRLILVFAHSWLKRLVAVLDGICSRHVVHILLKLFHKISMGVSTSQALKKLSAASIAMFLIRAKLVLCHR